MIKVYENRKEKQIKAVVTGENSQCDAINRALRKMEIHRDSTDGYFHLNVVEALELDKLELNKSYTGTVTCLEQDEYDYDTGKKMAISKALTNYNTGLKKAFTRWQVAMLRKIKYVSPETFDEALSIVQKDS